MAAHKPQQRQRDHDEPLQRQIETLRRQLQDLQDDGPTLDVKATRRRFEFIEQRLEMVERAIAIFGEVADLAVDAIGRHLIYRHEVLELRDGKPDTILIRKARQRLETSKPKTPEARPNAPSAPSAVQK
jgi:hypothetical protein